MNVFDFLEKGYKDDCLSKEYYVRSLELLNKVSNYGNDHLKMNRERFNESNKQPYSLYEENFPCVSGTGDVSYMAGMCIEKPNQEKRYEIKIEYADTKVGQIFREPDLEKGEEAECMSIYETNRVPPRIHNCPRHKEPTKYEKIIWEIR